MSRNESENYKTLLHKQEDCTKYCNNQLKAQLSTDNEEDDDISKKLVTEDAQIETEFDKKYPVITPKKYVKGKLEISSQLTDQAEQISFLETRTKMRIKLSLENSKTYANTRMTESIGVASNEKINQYLEMIENQKRKEAYEASSNFKKVFIKRIKQNKETIRNHSINLNNPNWTASKGAKNQKINSRDNSSQNINTKMNLFPMYKQNSLMSYRNSNPPIIAQKKQVSNIIRLNTLSNLFIHKQPEFSKKTDLITKSNLVNKFAQRANRSSEHAHSIT